MSQQPVGNNDWAQDVAVSAWVTTPVVPSVKHGVLPEECTTKFLPQVHCLASRTLVSARSFSAVPASIIPSAVHFFSADQAGMQEMIANNLAQHNFAAMTKVVDSQ